MKEEQTIFSLLISLKKRRFLFAKIVFLSCLALFGISQKVEAATSYFSPSSGSFVVGNIFTVNVLVNTNNTAINNVDAVINFPSNLLEIVSVSKSGSIFSLWVEEPTFSNSAGTLSFSGGLPTPGYTGVGGKVLSVVFRAKNEGSASLLFSSAAIRANDGLGTDVFTSSGQALFNLITKAKITPPAEETPAPVVGKVPEAPSVSSPTHPDPEKWYANNDLEFSWPLPAGVNGVSFYFSKSPTSNPGSVSDGLLSSKTYQDVEEGIWYFHIKFRNSAGWGPITHRKVQIDSTSPKDLLVMVSVSELEEAKRLTLAKLAKDELSGLSHFEVSVNGNEPVEVPVSADLTSASYEFDLRESGTYSILVRAMDKAGNFIETTEKVAVEVPVAPVAIEKPVEVCLFTIWDRCLTARTVFFVLLLIILLLVLWILYLESKLRGWKERIKYYCSEIRKRRKQRAKERARKLKKLRRDADLERINKLKVQIEEIEKRLKRE
jgi:hypothetical protein